MQKYNHGFNTWYFIILKKKHTNVILFLGQEISSSNSQKFFCRDQSRFCNLLYAGEFKNI